MPNGIPEPPVVPAAITTAVKGLGQTPEFVLPVLQRLHADGCEIDCRTSDGIAQAMQLPPSQIEGVRSFYSMLKRPASGTSVLTCDGIACQLKGASDCRRMLDKAAAEDLNLHVSRSSCLGLCDRAPAILVGNQQHGPVTDWPDIATEMCHQHRARSGEQRFVLRRCGEIDPRSFEEARNAGAWNGLQRAFDMERDDVISEIESAGLRGRGGAGYPTAHKWRIVANTQAAERFVIANADESEPLMFKDRVLIESDPHALLEGMAIAGYAVGAERGCVYIRGEYEHQAQMLENAIDQARTENWLGREIQGRDFSFDIEVHRGAGAYICGEETALLESLEGRRGEPRLRPPYPAESGYQGMPTIVNNVETLATCAAILAHGSSHYQSLGTSESPGTRLFTLLGHVKSPGLVELPLGLSLRTLFNDFAGRMLDSSDFHFALTGGAAGTIVGPELLDEPIGHDSWKRGIAMGSGGILICDQSVSPVEVVHQLTRFFEAESCGKCTPCRAGTVKARVILERLLAGDGTKCDIKELERTAGLLKQTSFCGLGTSAAEPILSALQQFRSAFEGLIS